MRFEEEYGVQSEVLQPLRRAGTPRRPQDSKFALVRAIPDDPDYQRHIPLNYRLDAKAIVGEVAGDISSRGHKAHFWVELSHFGLGVAEVAAEASVLVAGLAIAGPLLAMAGNFLQLGSGYASAAEEIAKREAARGFARGVVMGANRRKAKLLKDYFGNEHFPPNHFFPHGRNIAIANFKTGLLVGFVQGRVLTDNQHVIFHRDLGHRMGDQSYRGPTKQWQRRDWINWYIDLAARFQGDHLV